MITLVSLALIILISFISWLNVLRIRRKVNLPGPFPVPILGSGHMFLGDSLHFMRTIEQLMKNYGSDFFVQLLSRKYIALSDPQLIEPIILNAEYNYKAGSYYYLKPWLGEGLLTVSGGTRWKTHRKFLTPAFHFNILQNFLPVFCKNTKILTNKLERFADGHTSFDLFPIIALAALDNVTEAIMGTCVNSQKDSESDYVKAINDLCNLMCTRMRNPILGEDILFNMLPHKGRQERALKIIHRQTQRVIDARREELSKSNISEHQMKINAEFGMKNKHAFLDLLLMAEIDGAKIDDEKVREEVDTFMFEGHDTTTSGIVFCLYCLSKRCDVQEKILKEQQSIFDKEMNRDPTYNELAQMKYLECVIKEALRLYPSVPFIERYFTRDAIFFSNYATKQLLHFFYRLILSPDVADLHIPKNTSVIFNILYMQRRPDLYSEPEEFIPERFQNDPNGAKNAIGWIPFSAGPRNCIGQKFAMMEMKVTLSAIVKKFKILPGDREMILIANLILKSQTGVHVKLIRRD